MSDSTGTEGAPQFVGTSGNGANIDLDLPQPGHHTGRRILKIDGISDKYWKESAASLGDQWSKVLGLDRNEDGKWEIADVSRLTSRWFGKAAAAASGYKRSALDSARAAVEQDAYETIDDAGNLRLWLRKGSIASRVIKPATAETVTIRQEIPDTLEARSVASFQTALAQVENGIIALPSEKWGGAGAESELDLEAEPEPALFILQIIGVSSFLGDYGLGRTVKTFTLLPGESTTISTRTWRATEETTSQASSIIDSYDESSSERFADTVLSETTDTATQASTENWHVEAEVSASWGWGSASVSGGGGGEYSSSTEEFSRAVNESVEEHAAESSSHRESTVTSSSESSQATEDEEVVERSIQNINVARVLNFVFRELNQEYLTKVHLKEVRIGFSNGNSGSWREEPLSGLRRLLEEVIEEEHVDTVASEILRSIAIIFDKDSTPVKVIEKVTLDQCGENWTISEAMPDEDCEYEPPAADGSVFYRFKRGPLNQPPETEFPVDGVLMKENAVVLSTDSVVVEALLGQSDALDDYSHDLQIETIREQRLLNSREALAQRIVNDNDAEAAELYAQIFQTAEEEESEEE